MEIKPKQLTIYRTGDVFITEYHSPGQGISKGGLKQGNDKTTGRWGSGASRRFKSRIYYMNDIKKNRLKTFILTYRNNPTEEIARKNLNAFLQYLRRKGLINYAWALEIGKKGKKMHYHFIADMPYISAEELSRSWGRIRKDQTTNCVRGVRELQSESEAATYISKIDSILNCSNYNTKGSEKNDVEEYLKNYRLHATSQDLVGKEKMVTKDANLCISVLNKVDKWELFTLDHGADVYKGKMKRNDALQLFDLIEMLNYHRQKAREEEERKQAEIRLKKARLSAQTKICEFF